VLLLHLPVLDNHNHNTQVLHIRNLPPDATEADIMQLCKPYGRVVRLRLNAGAIKHQAFVEFENVNVAMQMIYSFVGSADPPRVRQQSACCCSRGPAHTSVTSSASAAGPTCNTHYCSG
jgi:hypothetical protein